MRKQSALMHEQRASSEFCIIMHQLYSAKIIMMITVIVMNVKAWVT